ncbi:MAG: hypothetical protein K2O60_08605 [Ruminococcus sp.]|nr:hypothetical protein [Ruminococcus sp.]
MSRSFIIETNQDKNLKVKDFMDNLKNLIIFNTTDLKIVHNRNNIYPDSFDEISLNTGLTVFMIDDSYIYITYHGNNIENNKFWWYIQSRALEGRGRSLFVASACIIANLTGGLANSADGAWYNPDKFYYGSELWNEYLNIELNYH